MTIRNQKIHTTNVLIFFPNAMKTIISRNRSSFSQERQIEISRLTTSDKHQYKPCPGEKGLQCKGDQFDYVVEWEIHEEAEVSLLR